MATAKVGLWLAMLLGWSSTVISLAGEISRLLNIPALSGLQLKEPYQSAVSVLAILFLVTMICRSVVKFLHGYEIYRDKKITNDERVRKIKNHVK